MYCPDCKCLNPKDANFCYACGYSLTLASKANLQDLSYDEKLAKIQRYLPKGLTEKILAQRDKIEGERKKVTVMFCDMKGFTPLTEALGPEETFSLMDQFFEVLIHTVRQHEGSVNELRGDGMLALFGAPIALEDAPQQAIRAGIDIHREIKGLNRKLKSDRKIPPILSRIGINTGPVVVGGVGNDLRVQFAVVGDTINLASRMESLAEPGTTYVTEKTFMQTKDLFQFEIIGKKSVKGKGKAVPVYKVLSAKEDVYRPRLGAERKIYSEMVGRDNELDSLELQVMKAINGKGSIVNIIGEAGIGKSRLVAELKKREVMKKVAFFEGRAISIGRNLSFHPIIDLIKQWARIRADQGDATSFRKLERAVKSLYPEEVGEVLPFVATLMGMKLSGRYAERVEGIEGEALEKLILKNVRDLLIKAAERNPLVIVAEDLHWADTSSIDLLESLFLLAETQRILFINVFRPDHKRTGDRIVETIKERLPVYYVEIVLNPLSRQMSELLITNMLNLKGPHSKIVDQVVQRAEGNPLFIEEIVLSFIDEGAIVLRDGLLQATDKIRTMAIPYTINDVLTTRIDNLEEKTRNLLKLASVIGRTFFYRILEDVATTIDDIDGRLSYLKKVQFIRERERMGELECLFRHALVQKAAYESILLDKRKELHLRVARSIEKIFGHRLHEFYGMLAYHYSKAESLDKAEEYLIKAGEEALKSSASNEALNYYQEALDLYLKKYGETADPEKVAMFERNIALALFNRGQYEKAVEYFDKTLNHYWGELPKNPFTKTIRFLPTFFHFLITLYLPFLKFRKTPAQRDTQIIDLFYKKCKGLAIINPIRFLLEFLYLNRKVTIFDLTKFELGLEIFVAASSIFSFTGLSFRLSRKVLDYGESWVDKDNVKTFTVFDFSKTLHNYFEGKWKEIRNYDDDLVSKNLNIGDIYFASQHYYWHGYPVIYQGNLCVANAMVEKLTDISEVYDNELSRLLKCILNVNLLFEGRKLPDAMNEIEKGIEVVQRGGFNLSFMDFYSCKTLLHILRGEIEEANKFLQLTDKIRSEFQAVPTQLSNFYRSQFRYFLYLLEDSIKNDNKENLDEYRHKAIKSGRKLVKISGKAAQHRVESYKLMGSYYWLINKQKKALKWWNKSILEGERLGARLELSRTYFEVGDRLLKDKSTQNRLNGVKAEDYLEKARVLFEEMDLQWDLNELSRVVKE